MTISLGIIELVAVASAFTVLGVLGSDAAAAVVGRVLARHRARYRQQVRADASPRRRHP
jgi:hypothetical protein